MTEEKKRGFRIPSSYTVLFIIIAIMAVLTWFIPAAPTKPLRAVVLFQEPTKQ